MTKIIAHTINDFWIDKDTSKLKKPVKVYPAAIDTISSEHEGQIVYFNMSSKDYTSKASAETHKPKRERVEYPVIRVKSKPAKKKIAKTTNIKAFYSNGNDSVVNGKITPLEYGMSVIAKTAENHKETNTRSDK
jgi:hypothetical protein